MLGSLSFWSMELLLIAFCTVVGLVHIHRLYGLSSICKSVGVSIDGVTHSCVGMYALSDAAAMERFSGFRAKLSWVSDIHYFAEVVTYSGSGIVRLDTYLVPPVYYSFHPIVFYEAVPREWVYVRRESLFLRWLRVFIALLVLLSCCWLGYCLFF